MILDTDSSLFLIKPSWHANPQVASEVEAEEFEVVAPMGAGEVCIAYEGWQFPKRVFACQVFQLFGFKELNELQAFWAWNVVADRPPTGVIMICTEEQEEECKPSFTVEESVDLPDGVLQVSPVVRLEAESPCWPCEPRIRLYLPACDLADSAWRSTETGWEEIEWKPAGDGYALLQLEHFCDVLVGSRAKDAQGLTSRLYLSEDDVSEKALQVAFERQNCLHCRDIISKWLPSHRLSLEAGCGNLIHFRFGYFGIPGYGLVSICPALYKSTLSLKKNMVEACVHRP